MKQAGGMPPDYYEILGLAATASPDEIRQRYRELARRHHPDVSRDPSAGHQQFLRIREAYHVLSDPARRAAYDHGREAGGDERPAAGSRRPGSVAGPVTFGTGARVEVEVGGVVLECRLREDAGGQLSLAAPAGARRPASFRADLPAKLTLYRAGVCWETEAVTRAWIWGQPPVVVIGSLQRWREKRRRAALRAPREIAARLVVGPRHGLAAGVTLLGRTRDLSARGLSLIVTTPADVREGDTGGLALQLEGDRWSDELPVRLARVRQWLLPNQRTLEIGVEHHPASEAESLRWQECLSRLGVGD